MAAITGQILPSSLDPQAPGKNNIFIKTQIINTFGDSYIGLSLFSGSVVDTLPIEVHPNTPTGHFVGAYGELFYDRILITPSTVDVGNLASERQVTLSVFNAYFSNKTLENIQITGGDGISISGDTPPTIYSPLAEEEYIITIGTVGPATIDAEYLFDFTGTVDDTIVPIVGQRVALYPYLYSTGITELLEWNTTILTSYNGTEQRIKNRKAPRQSFNIQSRVNIEERNKLDSFLYGNRQLNWAVPIFSEQRVVTSSISSGDTVINVNTEHGDFREDSYCVLYENSNKFDILEIDSFTTTTITVKSEINDNYSSSTIVFPSRIAYLLNNPNRGSTGYNSFPSISFQALDNIELSTSPSTTQYNSLDVFLDPPLKSGDTFNEIYFSRADILDYETGGIEVNYPWSNIKPTRTIRYVKEGLEDIWNLRLWLHRRAGKVLPFWMPTFENNLRLISTGALTTTITVKNDGYEQYTSDRVHLAFFLKDSSVLLREAQVISENISGDIEVQLDSSLSVNASEIDFISYNGIKRLNSDKISITWASNNVAIFEIPIIEVSS